MILTNIQSTEYSIQFVKRGVKCWSFMGCILAGCFLVGSIVGGFHWGIDGSRFNVGGESLSAMLLLIIIVDKVDKSRENF